MKNLKTTILSACIALCCLTNGNAQEAARGKNRGKVVTPGSSGTIVVLGGGTSMPSSDGKDKAFLSNSTAINADAFFSLISKSKTSFGLNFGGTYNFGGSGGFGTTPNPFAVTGQTSSMVSDKGGAPADAGFRMGAGPQANFYFGKFIVSPMVLGEYFSMTQKEMSIVQTTVVGGQSYEFNLATLPETKTSGFAVTPKLRLHYMFNDRFGLFADASYTTGPKMETTVSKLIPNGNPLGDLQSYNLQQLQTGTMVKGETKSTSYSAMGFNFGVVIGLGRNGSKGWNGVAETAQSTDASKTSASCNCVAPPPFYVKEYPSSGNTLSITNSFPAYIPSAELSTSNTIHFGFAVNPCLNSESEPCIGFYRAIVNGHTVNSIGTGGNNHIQIPINYLVNGANTIMVEGVCGSTVCPLTSTIVNIGNQPPSSGTITLVKECCMETRRTPPYDTYYSGNSKFKMAGTVTNAVLEISSPSGVVYEPFVNGGTTACYSKPLTIQLVNDIYKTPIVGSTINGFPTATVTATKFECRKIADIKITPIDRDIIIRPEGPFRPFDADNAVTWTLDDLNGLRLKGSGTGKDGGKIDMSCPIEIDEETGKIFLTGTPEITKTVNGKTSKIKSDYKPTQKRDYVGHVTLLK